MKYDFAGYATRNDLVCADGRIIRRGAFKDCDGTIVPLVYNHNHVDLENVLGHSLLENRNDGVYTYSVFNESAQGKAAKVRVENKDITSLSIYANKLVQDGQNVIHGDIKEVSLVLAGANPGAYIEEVLSHGEDDGQCAIIYSGSEFDSYNGDRFEHADNDDSKKEDEKVEDKKSKKTIGDVFETLTEEQKQAVYAMIGYLLEKEGDDDDDDDDEEDDSGNMKHNVFDNNDSMDSNVLIHDGLDAIIKDGPRLGSLRESYLAHAADYGIENIELLYPEPTELNTPPEFIKRDQTWVGAVLDGVSQSPFSRVRTTFADITADEARAKGYMKGNRKKEEVFTLLRRQTEATMIYKKQKIDRKDYIEITSFDVVPWMKAEMQIMMREEKARAILFGDGRSAADEDKISELNVRPVVTDDDLYSIKQVVVVAEGQEEGEAIIDASLAAQNDYQGSGNLTAFLPKSTVTALRLLKDKFGHRLYKSIKEIEDAMGVDRIVQLPRGIMDETQYYGVILDLRDYKVGRDPKGQTSFFDAFDIDYNQMKYLYEEQLSGALVVPYSAIVLKKNV